MRGKVDEYAHVFFLKDEQRASGTGIGFAGFDGSSEILHAPSTAVGDDGDRDGGGDTRRDFHDADFLALGAFSLGLCTTVVPD